MVRYGNQEPTFSTKIDYHHSLGKDVCEMFEGMGQRLYDSQKHELVLFMARKEDNTFACRTICISKPRQNGKSFATRDYAVEMAGEGLKVLYSAHHGQTTSDMFNEILEIFRSDDELHALLGENERGVYKSVGREKIVLTNGGEIGEIRFQTRTSSAGRGGTFDIIIIDEAQELTESQLASIQPTTIASASGDPQMIYLGTPPDESCNGTVFSGLHRKAHEDPESCGFWWIEWAVRELPDMADVDAVLELAYETNPALGYRILEDVMVDAIKTATSNVTFAREHLGWWSSVEESQRVITEQQWDACLVESRPSEGIDSLGIKYSADGSTVSVSVCRKDGDAHFVELLFNEPTSKGTAWIIDFIVERTKKYACAVIDGQYGAQSLMDRLDGQVPRNFIIRPKIADVISAHTTFKDYVLDGRMQHAGQPQLANSATKSAKRAIGKDGGFGWKSNEASDASIVESAALATWASDKTRRNPNRKTGVAF